MTRYQSPETCFFAASADGECRRAGEERAVDQSSRISGVGPFLEREHVRQQPGDSPPVFRSLAEHDTEVDAEIGNLEPEHPRIVGIVGV